MLLFDLLRLVDLRIAALAALFNLQGIAQADLSQHDLSGFVPTRFEFEAKAAQLNMRLPQTLLAAVKAQAKVRGIPYTRFVRETLEKAIAVG